MNEETYAYWLSALSGAGAATCHRLLEYAGSFRGIWELSERELRSPQLHLTQQRIRELLDSKDEVRVIREWNALRDLGIEFYHLRHPMYPSRLRFIYDAPIGIFLKGRLPDPDVVSVAIVGSRGCSEYGARITRQLAMQLADSGFQVISGLARGIDGIAQKAAVDSGGYSCAVLGCGVDVCYPEDNRDTYDKLATLGGILSEYPPMTPPRSAYFPQRNRIISGLSDVVVVMEAKERSGSLITADCALDQGKDVYALPGRICDSLSCGCNRLIRQGAGIITSPGEFINDLILAHGTSLANGLPRDTGPSDVTDAAAPRQMNPAESPGTDGIPDARAPRQMTLAESLGTDDVERRILSVLGMDPKGINEIQDETGLEVGSLMKGLMKLTVRGVILQNSGRYVTGGDFRPC